MNAKNTSVWIQALPVLLIVAFFLAQVVLNLDAVRAGSMPAEVIVNFVLLSIPLGWLCFSLWLLIVALYELGSRGSLNPRLARLVYYAPRVLGVLLAVFASLFAWNALQIQASFGQVAGELLLSLLPALVIGAVVALAWRWEWVGAAAFLLMALYFLVGVFPGAAMGLTILLTYTLPLAAVAALFWINWRWRGVLRAGTQPVKR